MIRVSFSSAFKKAFNKRIARRIDLKNKFWQKLEKFTVDPFDKSLKTHKLSENFNKYGILALINLSSG